MHIHTSVLSIYLSKCSLSLYIYIYIYTHICLSIYLSIHSSIYLSMYPSIQALYEKTEKPLLMLFVDTKRPELTSWLINSYYYYY